MSEEQGPPEPGAADRPGFINRWRNAAGGPSTFVYVVVGVVALTLTILLAIIYFSASERDRMSPPICTDITMADAKQAVLRGDVDRLTIVYDDDLYTPTSERYGPVLAKIDYTDGTCSNLPQGVANQQVVYTIAGVIAFYNEHTERQQVEVTYQESSQLSAALFATPTREPTETPTAQPTESSTPEPTQAPTIAATSPVIVPPLRPEASPAPDATIPPIASPAAAPQATVAATP